MKSDELDKAIFNSQRLQPHPLHPAQSSLPHIPPSIKVTLEVLIPGTSAEIRPVRCIFNSDRFSQLNWLACLEILTLQQVESQMNCGQHPSLCFKQAVLGTSATQAKYCNTTSPPLPTVTIATTEADYLTRHFNSGRVRPSFSCNFPK